MKPFSGLKIFFGLGSSTSSSNMLEMGPGSLLKFVFAAVFFSKAVFSLRKENAGTGPQVPSFKAC